MARLIDADSLKKSIEEDEELKSNSLAYLLMNLMTCYIDESPTVDAEPVRHGHWETLLNGNIQCSQCGHEPYWDSDDWKLNCGNPYYCPNCGAKMDGKEDNK